MSFCSPDCPREALVRMLPLYKSCAMYPHHASMPHLTSTPTSASPPLPVALPHREHSCSFPLLFLNQAMEEKPIQTYQIHHILVGVWRKTNQGRCWRASPPSRPSLPCRRPRRRPSPSFSFIFPKLSSMNSTRSTPTPLYSNKWPFACALLIAVSSSHCSLSLLCPHPRSLAHSWHLAIDDLDLCRLHTCQIY